MSVRGLKQVQANLKKKSKQIEEANLKGLILIGEQGTRVVKGNTPFISGRLKNSMTYTINGKQYGGGGDKKDLIPINKEKNVVIIGTNVIYAPRVEYFAKNNSQGFMLRSFNQIKKVVLPNLKKSLKKVVK